MRNVSIKVFNFNELSETAKQHAYDKWSEAQEQYGYECHELEPFLALLEQAGVTVKNWHYSAHQNGFELENETINSDYNYISVNEVTGIRASKMALDLYYGLTTTKPAWEVGENQKPRKTDLRWVKYTHCAKIYAVNYDRKHEYIRDKNGKTNAIKYINTSKKSGGISIYYELYNSNSMRTKDTCFDGTWLGAEFSHALWDSVRQNTTESFSFYDHVSVAVGAIFVALEKECEYQQSMACFVENYANENEYLENGDIFDIAEHKDVA